MHCWTSKFFRNFWVIFLQITRFGGLLATNVKSTFLFPIKFCTSLSKCFFVVRSTENELRAKIQKFQRSFDSFLQITRFGGLLATNVKSTFLFPIEFCTRLSKYFFVSRSAENEVRTKIQKFQ